MDGITRDSLGSKAIVRGVPSDAALDCRLAGGADELLMVTGAGGRGRHVRSLIASIMLARARSGRASRVHSFSTYATENTPDSVTWSSFTDSDAALSVRMGISAASESRAEDSAR